MLTKWTGESEKESPQTMGKLRLDISPFLSNIISFLSHSPLSPSFSLHECFLSSHKLGAEMPSKERRCSVTVSFFVAALWRRRRRCRRRWWRLRQRQWRRRQRQTFLHRADNLFHKTLVNYRVCGLDRRVLVLQTEEERQVSVCTRVCEPVWMTEREREI